MECQIRKWEIGDATNLARALNNKNIQNNLRDGLPYPYTEKDAVDFIQAMLDSDKNSTFAFAITVNNEAVGSIGVFRKDNIHSRTAEMGYYIAEPFAYNTASCRILEKSGFVYEGTLRSNAVKNGQILDMKMYALIKK